MKIRAYPALTALSSLPTTARSQDTTATAGSGREYPLTSLTNRQAALGSHGSGRASPDAPSI